MKKIKIILSSRPKLLSEVIRNLIEHQPDMEMIGEVIDPLKLLGVVQSVMVDVVIVTPLKANGEPKLCRLLLVELPRLIIVTQLASGLATYLYRSGLSKRRIDDPSGQSILSAIREAVRSNNGK